MIAPAFRMIAAYFAVCAVSFADEAKLPQSPPSQPAGAAQNQPAQNQPTQPQPAQPPPAQSQPTLAKPLCQPWPHCILETTPLQPGAPGVGLKAVGETIDLKKQMLYLPSRGQQS
jgi:hypothetical protein